MKAVLLLTIFVALAVARTEQEYRQLFGEFKAKYNKQYESAVMEATRYEIFKINQQFVDGFNAEPRNFTVAMNTFGDMTNEEFQAAFLGYKMPAKRHAHNVLKAADPSALPSSVNWVTKGAVTHIKNQGQCGSCWSFSTTGSVEGCVAIGSGLKTLVCLSEQNLVDCSSAQGNEGCDGGLMDDAFQYIIANGGIDSESGYPYTAETGSTCNYQASDDSATITSYTDVTSGSESALQTAVAAAPVSVAIDASQNSFQFYSSGVYSDPNCSSTQLDHGVLAVGYGTDSSSGSAYWLVKNSWGTDWGLNGYIWMARNDNNMCGIATSASFPTGCKTTMSNGHGC